MNESKLKRKNIIKKIFRKRLMLPICTMFILLFVLVGSSDTFNLKLWVNEEYGKYANNKNLVASIELTLYSDNPIDNYIIYDIQGGSLVQKTNVNSYRVSNQVPTKAESIFLGWSETPEGEVKYQSNSLYENKKGMVLYALWKKPQINYNLNGGTGSIASNDIDKGVTQIIPVKGDLEFLGWSTSTSSDKVSYKQGASYDGNTDLNLYAVWTEKSFMNHYRGHGISDGYNKIHFISISDEELEALDVTTYDLTYDNKGKVTAWIKDNVLYIGSKGKTYLTTGEQFFDGESAEIIDTTNMDTSYVTSMKSMFADVGVIYIKQIIGIENWDVSNITDMSNMFGSGEGGIGVESLNLSNWNV